MKQQTWEKKIFPCMTKGCSRANRTKHRRFEIANDKRGDVKAFLDTSINQHHELLVKVGWYKLDNSAWL